LHFTCVFRHLQYANFTRSFPVLASSEHWTYIFHYLQFHASQLRESRGCTSRESQSAQQTAFTALTTVYRWCCNWWQKLNWPMELVPRRRQLVGDVASACAWLTVDCVGDKGYEGGARGDVRRSIYVAVENIVEGRELTVKVNVPCSVSVHSWC